ncbi:serine hydrolase domain-containing protein [Enterococcus sp. AZ192]|uniref:serine hydrolase domain-containing protein n=1 Tax=unclassified Enterococcus TaxID=2608891 RepID=UPI003D297FAF
MSKRSKKIVYACLLCVVLVILGYWYFKGSPFFSEPFANTKKADKTDQSTMIARQKEIDQLIVDAHFKGAALVIDRGQVFYEKGYGYADVETKQENKVTTTFPIASLQKIITGALILQLVNNKQLSLDTTLDQFYPTIETAKQITIKDLLNHTSGLMLPEEEPDHLLSDQNTQIDYALKELEVDQGQEYLYSNGNYTILAGIISMILKQPYEEVVQERVVDKLGLKQTYFWDTLPMKITVPKPYIYAGKDYQPDVFPSSEKLFSSLLGAGNMYMSTTDFWQFIQGLTNGKLFKSSKYDELAEVKTGGYQSGMIYFDSLKYSVGSLGGYNTVIYGDQENQQVVILFANQIGEEGIGALAEQVYQQVLAT